MDKSKFRIEQFSSKYLVSPPKGNNYFTVEEISEILYSLKGGNFEVECQGRIDRVTSIRIGDGIAKFYVDEG